MSFSDSKTAHQLRVATCLLVLIFGVITPAFKLVLPTPVTCGMACCEASGVCYCEHQEAEATGAQSPSDEHAKLAPVTVNAGCPSRCAQIPSGPQKHAAAPAAALIASLTINHECKGVRRSHEIFRDALVTCLHAPRAPPLRNLS